MANTSINNENQDLYNVLVEEVKERLQKLKEYGISEKEISSLFHTEQPLLRLTISKNYRIFIGDERKEIHMQPLVKLFCPEALLSKCSHILFQFLHGHGSDIRPLQSAFCVCRFRQSLQSVFFHARSVLRSWDTHSARFRESAQSCDKEAV